MVSFDSKTIYNAWKNLNHLDAKIGGMFCILSCINEEIVPNKSYKIDGIKLRQQLSYVFDKEYKSNFISVKNTITSISSIRSYICKPTLMRIIIY